MDRLQNHTLDFAGPSVHWLQPLPRCSIFLSQCWAPGLILYRTRFLEGTCLLDLTVVLVRGSFKHFGVGFTRLAKKLLKLLPLAPRLISQLLERSLGAMGLLLRLALLLLLL